MTPDPTAKTLWLIPVGIVLAVLILAYRIREALTTDWPHAGCDDWEVW